MYWNYDELRNAFRDEYDKLQHEMYWNEYFAETLILLFFDKLQHEMYWNLSTVSISGIFSR